MKVNDKQIDLISELVNIGMGRSADILNQMLNSHITLGIPHFKVSTYEQIQNELGYFKDEVFASVSMSFKNDLNGNAKLVFPIPSASELVNIFVGKYTDETDLDALRIGALTEIGNIIINTIIGTISNYLEIDLAYSIPMYSEGNISDILDFKEIVDNNIVLFCHTDFNALNYNVSGNLILYFELGKFNEFIKVLDNYYNKII